MPTATPLKPSPEDLLRLDDVSATGADFHRRGWSLATSSNYSIVTSRDPLELLVTVSGKDKGKLTRDDYVLVGGNGKPVHEGSPASSAETLLHVVIAEQPGVGAILHTHSVWGTLLSGQVQDANGFEIAGYEMLKALNGRRTHEINEWIPVFDNTQDIPVLAAEVREWLAGEHKLPPCCFLISKHGLYTWGKDVAEARRQIEALEFLFECEGRRLSLPAH